MIIYEDVKKNIKITIYSKHKNILKKVVDELEKNDFKVEEYENIDKLLIDLTKGRIKILVYLFDGFNLYFFRSNKLITNSSIRWRKNINFNHRSH